MSIIGVMTPIPSGLPRLQPGTNKPADRRSTKKSENDSVFFGAQTPPTVPIEEKKEPTFADMLEQIAPANRDNTKDINKLWKDLPQLERDLIQTKTPEALENYKVQVRALLSLILEKNTTYKKTTSPIPGTMQKKEYTHIEYLDEKLKMLAEIISHPQNSAFQILKQMDNIKGFLIDIQR